MDKEAKKKWIEALRSGKYKQGQYALRDSTLDGDKFCCLGVLCDIYNSEGWTGTCGRDEWVYRTENDSGEVEIDSAMLPRQLCKGLEIPISIVIGLVKANDEEGKSFEQISDIIEGL